MMATADPFYPALVAEAEHDPDVGRFVRRHDDLRERLAEAPRNRRAGWLLFVARMKTYEGDLATANESLVVAEHERAHRVEGERSRAQRVRAKKPRTPRLRKRVLRRVLDDEGDDFTAGQLLQKLERHDGELQYENEGTGRDDRDEVWLELSANRDEVHLGMLGSEASRTEVIATELHDKERALRKLKDALSKARRDK